MNSEDKVGTIMDAINSIRSYGNHSSDQEYLIELQSRLVECCHRRVEGLASIDSTLDEIERILNFGQGAQVTDRLHMNLELLERQLVSAVGKIRNEVLVET